MSELCIGSDECTAILLVWNHLIISSCFEACGIQRLGPVLYHAKNEEMYGITFSWHVALLYKQKYWPIWQFGEDCQINLHRYQSIYTTSMSFFHTVMKSAKWKILPTVFLPNIMFAYIISAYSYLATALYSILLKRKFQHVVHK